MELELKSVMGKLNTPNHNGRIYSSEVMETAIKNWKENGKRYGEINPFYDGLSSDDFFAGDTDNISHETLDVWIHKEEVYGKIKLLDTQTGQMARKLIESGKKFKLSPRMVGDVEPVYDKDGNPEYFEDNKEVRVKNVNILSFDIL